MLIRAVLCYFSSVADIKFRACAPLLEHVTHWLVVRGSYASWHKELLDQLGS